MGNPVLSVPAEFRGPVCAAGGVSLHHREREETRGEEKSRSLASLGTTNLDGAAKRALLRGGVGLFEDRLFAGSRSGKRVGWLCRLCRGGRGPQFAPPFPERRLVLQPGASLATAGIVVGLFFLSLFVSGSLSPRPR